MAYMKIQDHDSSGYAARTKHNADSADVTIAVAVNFSTAGERLTKKLAQDNGFERYVPFYFTEDPVECARKLYVHMKCYNLRSINVAGNGVYSLSDHGYSQEDANLWIYQCLSLIHEHLGITKIVSGGQSGVDLAGGVAAKLLEIDCVMTLPRGYKQRWEDGVDKQFKKWDIVDQVDNYSDKLKEVL